LKLRIYVASKMKDLITGLARRVREHKKKCIERRGKKVNVDIKYADQPLVSLQSIENETMGAPLEGNAFIDTFSPAADSGSHAAAGDIGDD
jgi:hypothetical protein